MTSIWLPILIAVPFIGAIVGAVLQSERAARAWALIVSLVTALVGVVLAWQFWSGSEVSLLEFGSQYSDLLSFPTLRFSLHLGADAISLWLILLTVLLQPLAIAASFASIKDRSKQYYAWMLVLLGAMLGCFAARDVLLFYIFFELTLVPMFFIIGIWGGPQRRYAAGKFFLFTFTGSLFALAAIIYLGIQAHTFEINALVEHARSPLISDRARLC